jgi:hypothetical protein
MWGVGLRLGVEVRKGVSPSDCSVEGRGGEAQAAGRRKRDVNSMKRNVRRDIKRVYVSRSGMAFL